VNGTCVKREQPKKRCGSASWVQIADPIYQETGEFVVTETDLEIPGRGFDFRFTRVYSSQGNAKSALGYNWSFAYDLYLTRPLPDTLILANGPGERIPYYALGGGVYRSTLNYYGILTESPDGTFVSRTPDGLSAHFLPLDGSAVAGKLARIVDRNGNTMSFIYDDRGRLAQTLDTLGRAIHYEYDAAGHLAAVVDFLGRRVAYAHDDNGDLVRVTRPAGATGGQDRTTKYTYTSGFADARLNHNLVTVTNPNETALDPDGPAAVINAYETDPASYAYDRVIRQQINSAGSGCCGSNGVGTIYLAYELLDPAADTGAMNTARTRTTVTDQSGRVTQYDYNAVGGLVRQVTWASAGVAGSGAPLITGFTYNYNGEQTSVTDPKGDRKEFTYDEVSDDRLQQGNLLREERLPAPASGETPLVTTYAYEPVFNQKISQIDPAGNTTRYAYDAAGNQIGITDALSQTTSFTYDSSGTRTGETDPNGHTTQLEVYYLAPPHASFVVTPTGESQPASFLFDASSSWDLETAAADLLVRWDWEDDGHYDTPYSTIKIASHRYTSSGHKVARLEVMDTDHLTATATSLITVPPQLIYLPIIIKGSSLALAVAPETRPASDLAKLTFTSVAASSSLVYQRVVTTTDALGNITREVYDAYGNLLEATDANGHTTTYTYDAFNQRISATDALGRSIRYEYDLNGNRTRLTDADGNNTTYQYDMRNLLVAVTDPLGATTRTGYDATGNKISETDASDHTTTFAYDAFNRLIQTVDALGNITRRAYDSAGNLIGVTDPNDRNTTYAYDSFNRLVRRVVDAGGLNLATDYAYDANGNVLGTTASDGALTCYVYDALNRRVRETRDCHRLDWTTAFSYDAAGNLVRTVSAGGVATDMTYDPINRIIAIRQDSGGLNLETAYQYDPVGNLLSVTDARGMVTAYTYDAANRRLTEQVDSGPGRLNLTTTYAYGQMDWVIAVADPNGRKTVYQYDALGQTLQVTDPLGNATRYRYDAVGNRVEAIDPDGRTTTYRYDALNRPSQVVNALGDSIGYRYDGSANLVEITDPLGQATRYEYDGANRRTAEIDPLDHRNAFAYDTGGRLTQRTDPLGQAWRYQYDTVGRLIAEANPLGEGKAYTYDAEGNRTSVTEAIPAGGTVNQGRTTTYSYNAVNWPLSETNPLGHTTSYAYDAVGNRTAITDAKGSRTVFTYDAASRMTYTTDPLDQVARYSYDAAGQLLAVAHPNSDTIGFGYDAAGRPVSVAYPDGTSTARTYDAAGYLLKVVGPNTDVEITYDAIGRPSAVTDNLLHKTVGYTYDAAGHRLSLAGPDGTTTDYAYDAAGQRISVTQGGQLFTFDYDAAGRPITDTLPNGIRVVSGYDDAGRVTEMRYARPDGALLDRLSYIYDAAGNRTRQAFLNGDAVDYGYDAAGQLVTESRTGSIAYNQAFTYDPAGNRTRWISDTVTVNYTYDAANRLLQQVGPQTVNYTYDANGNLVKADRDGQELTSSYTYEGMLERVRGPGVEETNRYDAFNRRVAQDVNGAVTRFVYDRVELGATVLAEYDAADTLVSQYVLAPVVDGQLARVAGGAPAFYLRDGLGSIVHLVNPAGDLLNSYGYDGFGREVLLQETVANPYRFAARRWDAALALYDSRDRVYDPDLGRFLQPDPLGYMDATNLYVYALNDPVNRIDPLGWAAGTCHSISYESEHNLGLLAWANRLSALLRFLPSAPSVEFEGKWKVTGELCSKCCESGPYAGQWKDSGEINVTATANMKVSWPLAAWQITIRSRTLKIGIEAYAEFSLDVSGSGKIDYCENELSVKVCGGGSITGGVRGGLLEWPFEAIEAVAYIYGQITGTCQTCVEYGMAGGFSLQDTRCSICGEAGYRIEVKWWRFTFTRRDTWWQSGGC